MFDFDRLWSDRLKRHLIKQNKYLRYVFNDHLMLAFVFLGGALAFWYSNQLQLITNKLWWSPIVLVLATIIGLSIGQYASLFEYADQVFLLPKEARLSRYLKQARRYSLILPILINVIIGFILTPFVLRASTLSLLSWIMMVLGTLIFKDSDLRWRLFCRLERDARKYQLIRGCYWFTIVVSLTLGIYWQPEVYPFFAGLFDILLIIMTRDKLKQPHLDWRSLISAEATRQTRILRFYNLFIDVPEIGGRLRELSWLNGLVNWWSMKQPGLNSFLYIRAFVRHSDYSGIWLRFLLIGAVLLSFISQTWVLIIITVLFLYLTGYQLIPLASHFDHNAINQLYPQITSEKSRQFQGIIRSLLLLEWLIYTIALIVNYRGSLMGWVISMVGLLVVLLFAQLYLPTKLVSKRKEN